MLFKNCCISLFICISLIANISAQTNNNKKVPVLELSGTAYERGLQHGTQLKTEIATIFKKWKANMRSSNPDSLIAAFLKATNFEPAIKQHIPAILDELKGIAAGSGQAYTDVYAFQLLDEFWVYLDRERNEPRHHCSGMGAAATKTSPAYIAQNMDVENYMQGGQVLLHIPATKTEPEQYIVTCAGLVALNGMNSAGIGMCMNTILELESSYNGLPVAFIIRAVLNQQNGREALNLLQAINHASGQNYILGVGEEVYDFEASANKVIRYIPAGGDGSLVYHTNHAVANDDVKPWYKKLFERNVAGQNPNDNSVVRMAALQNRLTVNAGSISPDIIKSALRSKDNPYNPVCRVYREGGFGFTFSSILFTLTGKKSVQLTYGSPDQAEYVEYFFK